VCRGEVVTSCCYADHRYIKIIVTRSKLEIRYRRLLRCYPIEHRCDHEDEMIGVLLAEARPRQSWPDPRVSFDLLRGALLIRLRHVSGAFSAQRWRDAFALMSFIAPVMLLALSLRYLVHAVDFVVILSTAGPVVPGTSATWWEEAVVPIVEMGSLWMAWGIVALLALLGARRVATAGLFILPVILLGLALFDVHFFRWGAAASDLPVILGLLTGVALRVSAGAEHGRKLLGLRGRLLLAVMAVALAAVTLNPPALSFSTGIVGSPVAAKTVLLAAPLAYGGLLLRSPAGRRACALLAMPGTCLVYRYVPIGLHGTPVRIATFVLALPLVGLLLAIASIRLLELIPRVVRR
jgi:hypothetical protein